MSEAALERTARLFTGSPDLERLLLDLAHRNALPNQDKLGLTPDQIEALVTQRRLIPGGRITSESATMPETRERASVGLEAIVRQVGRPSLLVQDGTVRLEGVMDGFPVDVTGHLARIEAAISRAGRVELTNHRMDWAGTAWLVGERGLAITNRHVAELFAGRRGTRGFGFLVSPVIGTPYGAKVDFLEEQNRPAVAEVRVRAIRYVAALGEPDIALLELETDATLPDPVELAEAEAVRDRLIGVIGYPAYDSRNDSQDIAHYFGDIFDKKRFAPGFVTQAPSGAARLMHDSTTLGGNSGSVILDLESGKALGLHFAGNYLEGNFAVPLKAIKAAISGERAMVSIAQAGAAQETPDGEHRPQHFAQREGYRDDFLGAGFAAPLLDMLPSAMRADAAEITSDDGTRSVVIPYRHFSVVFSASRRVPRVTAVNIDGAASQRIKRGDDQWFRDLRIERTLQLGREDYDHPAIDRGHMVRREDPNWGSLSDALQANDDTFHYTNAAPQHAGLNQNKQAWLGLEDYILGSARTHGLRASVFTGPVLRDGDRFLEGKDVQIPREFWKVVVMVDADQHRLHATGYVLGQGDLVADLTEGVVFGAFRTYQVRIADIAKATGIEFGALALADPLARLANDEAVGGRPVVALQLDMAAEAYLG